MDTGFLMSSCALNMSANTPVKKPSKEGEHLQSHPDFSKNFKLINDPILTRCPPPTYRYDGVMPGLKSPIEVVDPRLRFPRTTTRSKNIFLPIPEFIVDKHYVLPIKPKEVSFTNLNNNVNVKFLEDMCKCFGIIQDTVIYYHPATKKHLGLGKVFFTTSSAAQKCVDKLNNTSSMGNILHVFLDDKGAEREKLFKELTKDPSKAEFMPPMPNSHLKRDVLMGMFPVTSTPTSVSQSVVTANNFASPGADKIQTPANHNQAFIASQTYLRSHSLINSDHSTNGDVIVLQRKSSTSTTGNVHRSSSGEGLFGSSISGNLIPDLAGKSSQRNLSTAVVSSSSTLHGHQASMSPVSSSVPFHNRQACNFNQSLSNNSRESRPQQKPSDPALREIPYKDKSELHSRVDKYFDNGAKERPFRREDRHAEKKWTWHQGKDYKDRQNKNGDKSNWKDKYSSPNNRKDRNRDKKDCYDNPYHRSGWSKQVRDSTQESSIRVPDNSQSFENLIDSSHVGTPGISSNDRGKSKSIDTPDKNGQTTFSDLDDKKTETAIKTNFLDKRMNLLANSDDNAVDSSHLFVQCPKKTEPADQEDDKHESLESRIQALLGQNLPFALPGSTAQIPAVPQSVLIKSPPQPPLPLSPSPPLPPPPSQRDSDINVPPPSIYSFPPPPLTVPLPMTPVVPPNISYPPLPQNLSIFPIPVGSVPPLVAQHVEPGNHPAMMVQWRFHSEAVSTPPPSMTLPPLNIPPPPLPSQGLPAALQLEDPDIKRKEEEKAKFRKVFNELIYQLKEVLSKDLKKKMIEATAFKEFEDWWNDKSKEHNEKILNSKQQMKMTGSSSSADLKNGDQKVVVAAISEKSSAIPPPDRTQIMDTLSGLFDKSGSFAGGLLGLRKMRLTSLPSFRKKPELPKIGNERIKNIHEDDEDEDEEDMNQRPVFRGPRTPEGSENEDNLSDSLSGSGSDSETLHVGRPDTGKGYKPPSPPPSPIHVRKEPDKKSKVKKTQRKAEKPKQKSQKMEIYSSSSSDSDFSRKEGEDYDDELSDGSSDIDVMNLVKKVKEPTRKFAVYTSDEEEEDYADGPKRTSTPQKGKLPSICSSPSVSDSDSGPEKQIDVCTVDRNTSKKSANIKTSTPKLKPPVGRSSTKVQKEEGTKRKYTSRKPKNSLPQKKPRLRSKSTRGDDDDGNYISHIKKVDARSSDHLKENDHVANRQQVTGERKRCTSLASAEVRLHETKHYEEIRPVDGYLHLLSDVASEVKQAEVDKTYSTAFFASDQTEQQSNFGSVAHLDEEMRDTRKIRTYSQGDVPSQERPLQEMEKRLPPQLDDHYYSLKPWAEVKSKKGRKPKHKPSAPAVSGVEFDASSGDETVALFPSDDEAGTKFSAANLDDLPLHLQEHSYASANVFSPDVLYRSRSSDSEGDDAAINWPQVYVEDLDVSITNNMGRKKFTLEMIPHIGKEVDISVEKPEQERNINVVDDEDEEEEGECRSSSEEDKMVIDEGLSAKPAPGRKRKRSTVDAEMEVSEKKMKVEKKFQQSIKHSSASGKLPRELVNLIQSSFSTPESKPVKFMKRDFKEEAFILYDFVTKGIDEEDANFIKLQFEKIHQREQEKMLDHMESHCKWAFESKWVDHPVKTDFDSPSSKKSRKSSKHKGFEPHKSGSARTEGYYKIPHQAKQYLKHAHGVQEQQSIQVNSDDFPASSISSTSLMTTETTLDAMVRKRAQQNREARSEGRRWQNLLASNLGEDVAELLKFNQLQIRKKQLRFAKSRIHDWGLFAMEPIAEGELVIEYVGQIIRQSVADLREKRYEADGIGSSYLFRIDQSTIVDATRVGNLSRFINHCCNPNCYAKIVSVDGVKRIVIYSRRDIEVNEEITYDYKFPIEDDKIPCLCGASGCRGTLN